MGNEPPGVRADATGSIGFVTIDNPRRRNAMTSAMYGALPGLIDELVSHDDLRVIVVRGAGTESFSAGSDVSEFRDRRSEGLELGYENAEHAAWRALADCPHPTIAAIHGTCFGGGVALALHCDLRIASDAATFAVPPARLGLSYPSEAVERLVAIVGPAWAKRMLFTAQEFGAATALETGLVDELVSHSNLDDRADDLAARISALAPLSIRAAKLAVDHHSLGMPAADEVATAGRRCYLSRDYAEGIAAFVDKRVPRFTGA